MQIVKFSQEPGFTEDLLFTFFVFFNRDFCRDNILKGQNDLEFIDNILNSIAPIHEDLLPFFYIKEDNLTFFTQYIFQHRNIDLTNSAFFSNLMAKITDYEDVVKSLFEFYFPDLEKEYLSHFNYNSWELGKKIRNSIYSASVKNGLYSIAVDPMQAIHKLSSELLRVQHYLAKEYERTEESRRILQSGFDYVKTLEILKENKICQGIDFEQYREIVVSFLFCNIQHIDVCCNGQTLFLFLGRDYVRRLEELSTTAAISALDTFGNAIAEKNRVAILDLIKENGDVSISEIKKILGLTEANIYYHLTLMLKAGLLKNRKQRKTIYYGLNKDYFELIIQKIQQYL